MALRWVHNGHNKLEMTDSWLAWIHVWFIRIACMPSFTCWVVVYEAMSMLTRTGTIIRKQRRRSSASSRTSSRRESATTPTPSFCPIPSPSSSYSAYNHGGNYLHYHHSPELFASPFSTPDPSPLSLGGVKDLKFSFDVAAVKGHLALSKVSENWLVLLLFLFFFLISESVIVNQCDVHI